jgi:hypothetical protein
MHTANALIRLWLNAAFLPVAVAIDAAQANQPTDSDHSGAPEGADVVRLDDYREASNHG